MRTLRNAPRALARRLLGRSFTFQGVRYAYGYFPYHKTWQNERSVEIPIVWRLVQQGPWKRILEVGNVLSHYFSCRHDVVDKYEKAHGVTNQDIVDYTSAEPYDLVVSVSTLEHVGWDEQPQDETKVLRAFDRLHSLLAPGGLLAVTIPLAYHPRLDGWIRDGRIPFTRRGYLKRVSADNRWEEAGQIDVEGIAYDRPFPKANGLFVGLFQNAGDAKGAAPAR